MGVDWEKCDECKQTYPDCGDNYPCEAELDGEQRTICPSCLEELTADMDRSLDDVDSLHGLLFYFRYGEDVRFYHETELYDGRAKMIEVAKENGKWSEFGFLICDDTILDVSAHVRLDEDFDDDETEKKESPQQKAARIQKNLRWAWEHTCNNAKTVRMLQEEKAKTYDADLQRYERESDKWRRDGYSKDRGPTNRPKNPKRMCVPKRCIRESAILDVEDRIQEAIDAYIKWLADNDMLDNDSPVFVSRDQKQFKLDRIATLKAEVSERLAEIRAVASQSTDHAIAKMFGISIYKHGRDRRRADAFGHLLPLVFAFIDECDVYDKSSLDPINLAFCQELVQAFQQGVENVKPASAVGVKRKRVPKGDDREKRKKQKQQ